MRLHKHLAMWEKAKLITSKQSTAIWEFEQNKGQRRVQSAFLLLGIFCIGLGIIGLIASNWDFIPDWTKLTGCFALLAVPLSCAYAADTRQKEVFFELMLFAAFLMIGATIGLVSQIYHLAADIDKGLLTWSLVSLPLVLLSCRLLLPFVWLPLLLAGLPLETLLDPVFDLWKETLYFGTLLVGAFFAVLSCAARHIQKTYPEIALSKAVFVWSLVSLYITFIIGDTMIRSFYDGMPGLSLFRSLMLMVPFIGGMSYLSYATDHIKSFYANVIFGGFYMFSLYLSAFYSLATTGVGLIISGLLIIGFALLFRKIRILVQSVKGKVIG